MQDINSLLIFARVVEAKSFSQAAKQLSMPVSTVSRKIAELENQLEVRLLERSTRQLRLTEVGSALLGYAQQGVEISENIENLLSSQSNKVSGSLRLSAPPSIADSLLTPLIVAFRLQYPDVHVHATITERYLDHIAEGIDIALRVGPLENSSLIGKRVLRYRRQLFASPKYLEQFLLPEHPDDLETHQLITFSSRASEHTWLLTNANKQHTVRFQPAISMNDYSGIAKALHDGAGIGELPPIISPDWIKNGQLVAVLPDWHFDATDLFLVHLGGRHASAPVRLFKEFAVQKIQELFPQLVR